MTTLIYVALLLPIYAAQGQAALLPYHEQEFGIGFDLTPSYATAAVSFANGSNFALARVDGNVEWYNMMADISFNEGGNLWETRRDSHLRTLANMLLELARASEERLGQRPTAASASMPGRNIVAHYTTPVTDLVRAAFSAAKLDYIEIVDYSYFGEPLLYPENVLLAGHGLGLCQPYTSSSYHPCLDDDEQRRNLPRETYYMVGYYCNELELIATTPTVLAYGVTPDPYPDYRLGADARYNNPNEDFYWEEVRRLLSEPLIFGRKPSKIIMYGDYSEDKKLVAVVKELLSSFLGDDETPVWVEDGIDPVFAGAFGAAEFAKRKPYWGFTSLKQPKTDL